MNAEERIMKKNQLLKEQMQNKTHLIWKMAIASAISWEIAKLAGSNHPYFAPISVILCLQSTINRAIRFSYHRMVGTIIGISVTVLAAPYMPVNGWTVGIIILIGCYISKGLKNDETALHQVALTVLLVFVVGQKSGDYPIDRFRDTLIGAIIAVLIHMLVSPPNFTREASKSIQTLSEDLTASITKVSEWVRTGLEKTKGYDLQIGTKHLLNELHRTKNIIQDARSSLKYNPFSEKSKKELQTYHQRLYNLTQGYSFLANIVGTFLAWGEAGTITAVQQSAWADQLLALTPFFQGKENTNAPAEILKVSLPIESQKQQYHVTIYHETIVLLKKLDVS
jgi:uncharacterized membrane protein YgaE (UPF0421/DUF939 family)